MTLENYNSDDDLSEKESESLGQDYIESTFDTLEELVVFELKKYEEIED